MKELMLTWTAREKVGELCSKSKILNQIITGKDSYLILDTLPSEYDSRVKAMEVDTRPTEHTEQYSDIGGLDT